MKLPQNDNALEMEEAEKLVVGGTPSSTSTSRIGSNTSNKKKKTKTFWHVKNMTRLIGSSSLLIVVALMGYSITIGHGDSKVHLKTVELKDHSTTNEIYIDEVLNEDNEKALDEDIEDQIDVSLDENDNDKDIDTSAEDLAEGVNEENLDEGEETNDEKVEETLEGQDEGSNDVELNESIEDKSEFTNDEAVAENIVDQDEEQEEDTFEFHTNENLIPEWGKWGFWDGAEDIRPTEDYCGDYPNCDIPDDKFPENAWQEDAVFVNHFLDAAANLVERAKEAIYTEYGYGKEGLTSMEKLERSKMFHVDLLDLEQGETPDKAKFDQGGGWSTRDSMKGLSRRLLHAMMTKDTFTVVMGGHSSAAGHGNHFQQSYMMAFHRFMEPIFKRMGVTLITRNLAQGGLGTLQSALGSGSIYGDEIDILVWDSGMTEREKYFLDLYYRQALLAGKRPPFLWGGSFEVLQMLHEKVGADVGDIGSGSHGIPLTLNEVQAKDLPWASRFLKCDLESSALCDEKDKKYRTTCWIDRSDVDPPTKQGDAVGGTAKWHPGWRFHQLRSRIMSFTVLVALSGAINEWSENTIFEGFPLSSEYWHVTDYYNDIKTKVRELKIDPSEGFCEEFSRLELLPERVCSLPLRARTEFTPRANAENNSIVEIVKPTPDGYIPEKKEDILYSGPNVPIPELDPPDDELDIREVVSNRRLDIDTLTQSNLSQSSAFSNKSEQTFLRGRALGEDVIPGSGWSLDARPGICDGTYDAVCGREPSSNCLLSGHMDHRGGILGDGLSGWLVMNVQGVKEGFIMLKMETWHFENENEATEGWTEVNNESPQRRAKQQPNEYCEEFQFQYAIDKKITSLNKDEFLAKLTNPQRVVEIFTILDDQEMAKEQKERDIEVAIRIIGCKREKAFKLTHLYWA